MITTLLLVVIAGHNIVYWVYRAGKVLVPIARFAWAMRASGRTPIPFTASDLAGFHFPPTFKATLEQDIRTDLSKFTTLAEHQIHETPPAAPPAPVDSAVQPPAVPPAAG